MAGRDLCAAAEWQSPAESSLSHPRQHLCGCFEGDPDCAGLREEKVKGEQR